MLPTIKIYNTDIHEAVNLRPRDFLKKVEHVQTIRTSEGLAFSFCPRNEKEVERNRLMWEYANGNLNAMNYEYRHYFVVEFPEWLYLFLRYSSWENVEKSIAVALTGLYTVEPQVRVYLERRVEKSIFSKVEDHFQKHFHEFESFVIIETEDLELMDEINSDYRKKEKLFVTKFDYFFRDHSGNAIILPYVYPIRDIRYKERSLFRSKTFEVKCRNSYFSYCDWLNIIENNSVDNLHRSESKEEPWRKWIQMFSDKHKIENKKAGT